MSTTNNVKFCLGICPTPDKLKSLLTCSTLLFQPEGEGEQLGIAIGDKDEEPELRWFLPDSFTTSNPSDHPQWYQGRIEVRPTELPDDEFADYQVCILHKVHIF